MRVAVVGTGFARQVHLPGYALVDGVKVAAICDNRPGRAEQVAGEVGADRWCENFDDILTMADVDVVDICTPPRLHAPMALAALAAGKAVICEKPMSSDLPTAERMAEEAARSGLRSAVHFQSRYLAPYRHLRRVIADGYLGEIRLVLVTAFGDYALNPRMEPHYATWASMAAERGRLPVQRHGPQPRPYPVPLRAGPAQRGVEADGTAPQAAARLGLHS